MDSLKTTTHVNATARLLLPIATCYHLLLYCLLSVTSCLLLPHACCCLLQVQPHACYYRLLSDTSCLLLPLTCCYHLFAATAKLLLPLACYFLLQVIALEYCCRSSANSFKLRWPAGINQVIIHHY